MFLIRVGSERGGRNFIQKKIRREGDVVVYSGPKTSNLNAELFQKCFPKITGGGLWGALDFAGTLAQIGLMRLLHIFIYILCQ